MDAALERLVWQRAQHRCEYCQLAQELIVLEPFQIDHIIALQHLGPTRASNLALACVDCNHHKGPNIAGIDPVRRKLTPLFNPRRHLWSRHFRWDGPFLVGLTPIGRVTVNVLAINLPSRVEFREMLLSAGLFPPSS